jgi:hypothetical protein
MGLAVKYKAILQNVYNGNTFTMKLRAVVIPKLAFALKNEDYTIQDLDFEAQADSTGAVLDASFTS